MNSEYRDILSATASVCTILQFFAGSFICAQYIKKGTTGEQSSLPFIAGFLSCSFWFIYGFLLDDKSLIIVNAVGTTIQFFYVIIYCLYSIKKLHILKIMLCVLGVQFLTVIYLQLETSRETAKNCMGLLCCFVTIIFFAAPLASLAHVIKVKSAEVLPFHIIVATFVVSLQWMLYGIIIEDLFIQIPNAIGTTLSALQLLLFVIYPVNSKVIDS